MAYIRLARIALREYAVKVGSTVISYNDFQKTFSNLRTSYQNIYGKAMTPELEKMIGLKNIALDRLINSTLVRNEAKQMGLKVSDAEVINAISSIPAFQKDGVFNRQTYLQLLQDKRLTPKDFEESEKADLLIRKTVQKITGEAKVTDAEALQLFKKRHDKIDLSFISFSPAEVMSEVRLTEQDLSKYLQGHQEAFKTPERVSISYILITPLKAGVGLSADNEEVQTYYRKNIDRYQDKGSILPFEAVKERVRADAIQFKSSKRAYELAADALNKNLKTSDLNAAAAALGLKVEKSSLFTMKQPPAAIASESELIQKSFILKPGNLGGPVETRKGVYLFTVNEKKPAAVPPLGQVRGEVQKLAAAEMALQIAHKNVQKALDEMKKGKPALKLQETGYFTYAEAGLIPKIGTAPQIMEAAFNLTAGSPTPKLPLKVNDRWYAIQLKERAQADSANFQKMKEELKQGMLPQKQQEVMETWLKNLRSKTKIVINPLLQGN
ncbi:MAG: SurA N-terminal domain-containing protein [Deltaproteobacteria bacterium]